MISFLNLILRVSGKLRYSVSAGFNAIANMLIFKAYGVIVGHDFKSNGRPILEMGKNAELTIGDHVRINNGNMFNRIGRQQRCMFILGPRAKIRIGNHVGISAAAIIAQKAVSIGDHVKIGGNVVIYDTDFHSLDFRERAKEVEAREKIGCAPVVIGDNVFIGGHSTILKGITIGAKSIIGACSVVTKNIPSGEIWGGNPARFIKKIEDPSHDDSPMSTPTSA